jgi:predicted alpha/beta-hydrolase family hydrolase
MTRRSLSFQPEGSAVEVSALLDLPKGARWLYAMAHGAGAGMRHPFMEAVSGRLNDRGVATIRYQFPYMESGRRAPDRPALLQSTVQAAVEVAGGVARGFPLVAGGKSLGGRMTSTAASTGKLQGVSGIVFLGFPLHQPGKPGDERAAHLFDVEQPMLFVQGTRDALADLRLIQGVRGRIGDRAPLHVVEGGDHSFTVLKRSGRNPEEVFDEIAGAVAGWLDRHVFT